MAADLPKAFKAVGLGAFAQRAAQLEKVDPVIAYWCEYYIVKRVLDKGLHTEGDECMTYTTNLMDKLERIKAAYPDNDAILDDVAAQAYVENFALKTFNRADNAVRNNRASAQAADTFRASATFLELLSVWNSPLADDIEAKIKFAKFHTLRIMKAIRAGEDPNASNPPPDPEPSFEDAPMLDPDDPEVQRINGSAALQPQVESARTSPDFTATAQSPVKSPDKPSVATAFGSTTNPQPDVSPLEPSPADRKGSIGGGYFPSVPNAPSVPTFTSETAPSSHPTAPLEDSLPAANGTAPDPMDFYKAQPPPVQPVQPVHEPTPFPPPGPPDIPMVSSPAQVAPIIPPQPPLLEPEVLPGRYRNDDESIAMSQKHAKWAVSALNFEDVDTAVKELRIALRALGAS